MLQVNLFGQSHVLGGNPPQSLLLSHNVSLLLAYLLLGRSYGHGRDLLAGVFWGDQSEVSARNCLKSTLWRLRRSIEPFGRSEEKYLVSPVRGQIGFNRNSSYWLDTEAFETEIARAFGSRSEPREVDASSLERALEIYTAELLEGSYEDWVLRFREAFRAMHLNALSVLMQHYRRCGRYDRAIVCGQRILAEDPLREDTHRDIMRIAIESGQRALAIKQYESCRMVLKEELGLYPMEETRAVVAEIAPRLGVDSLSLNLGPSAPGRPVQQLAKAVEELDRARDRLSAAMKMLRGSA